MLQKQFLNNENYTLAIARSSSFHADQAVAPCLREFWCYENPPYGQLIVKLRSRSRSGEGQEGQSQVRSSSKNSKLKDLDLSLS